ncbi:MAG: hypothetical protein HDQ97_16355 [Lachnospiraceae bacterium]|nr:hypothetical protein [Lachnospiraceae bacterium]
MSKSTEKKIATGLAAGSAAFILLIFITNLFHYNYHMNADIASETILGEVIWKSRQIIPDTWYPSTEVRIISIPNLASLFYGLTGNMILSSGLACCMMSILVLIAILLFIKSVEMTKAGGLMMVFLCLSIPSGLTMLELLYLYAGYYAIHVVILFVTLAMYASLIKERNIVYKFIGGGYFACLPAWFTRGKRNSCHLWTAIWYRID